MVPESEAHDIRLLEVVFTIKKQLTDEILMLNSEFYIIDQMFHQEIANAQIIGERWFYSSFYPYTLLIEPQKMNPFIEKLMGPPSIS